MFCLSMSALNRMPLPIHFSAKIQRNFQCDLITKDSNFELVTSCARVAYIYNYGINTASTITTTIKQYYHYGNIYNTIYYLFNTRVTYSINMNCLQ